METSKPTEQERKAFIREIGDAMRRHGIVLRYNDKDSFVLKRAKQRDEYLYAMLDLSKHIRLETEQKQ